MIVPLFDADRRLNIPPATPEGDAVTAEAVATKFVFAVTAVNLGPPHLPGADIQQVVAGYHTDAVRYYQHQTDAAVLTALENLNKKVDANTATLATNTAATAANAAATAANTAAINKRVDDVEKTLTRKMDAMHARVYGDRREIIVAENRSRALKGEELSPVPFVDQAYANSANLASIKRVDDILSMPPDMIRHYTNAYRTRTYSNIDRNRDELIKQIIGVNLATIREEHSTYIRGKAVHVPANPPVNPPANPPVTSRRVRTRRNPVTEEEEEE